MRDDWNGNNGRLYFARADEGEEGGLVTINTNSRRYFARADEDEAETKSKRSPNVAGRNGSIWEREA